MSLHQFLLILRAHYKVVLLSIFLTTGAALTLSVVLPKQYTASSSVFIDVKSPDPIAGMIVPALTMPGYVATQVDIIKSDRVAQQVVKTLKLDQSPTAKEQWLASTGGKGSMTAWLGETLLRNLEITPSRESSVINITYRAVEPAFAAAVANAFAESYIKTNIELKVEPARQYTEWFAEQNKTIRDNLERAQARLSEYQQQRGIVATDERLDNELNKLNELSTQLTVVQAQTSELQSKQRSGSASDTLPEIVQNPLIQNLRGDIARQEAKLKEASGNLGANHPQYQRMQAELAALKDKLDSETRHISSGFSTSSTVGRQREATLRGAIETQKSRLLELRRERAELSVLTRDVEAAQKNFEAVSQRFNQSRLESQSTQTNVSILTPAFEPVRPSSPKVLLNAVAALFLGAMLGIAAAFLLEMVDRRVRSREDLAEVMAIPVLTVIQGAGGVRRLRAAIPALPAP
jgi:succinoglycan biosynthesis transport protein ExoP